MPAPRRRPDVSWLPTVVPTLQTMLEAGEATRGLNVTARGGHLVVGRTDDSTAPTPGSDSLHSAGVPMVYRSIVANAGSPLPFEGTLEELAETMNHELGAWADEWS